MIQAVEPVLTGCEGVNVSVFVLDRTPPAADLQIAYGDGPEQFGELWLPVGAGPHPCVINIHGGYWRAKYDRSHANHLCRSLAHEGIAVWNLEYRRIGNAGGAWPGTFQDVARGAAHLFAVASHHAINSDRVVAMGHSAGGHLAAWLASVANVPANSEVAAAPLPIKAVVATGALFDLRRGWELQLSEGVVGDLLGGSPADVPERYFACSPIELVPPAVPVTLIHGERDDIVPIAFSHDYAAAVLSAGGDATVLALPEADHFDVIDPESSAWPIVVATLTSLLGVDQR